MTTRDRQEHRNRNLFRIFAALREAGVGEAVIHYYGGGDSGDVEEATFTRNESDPATSVLHLSKDEGWPSGTVKQAVFAYDYATQETVANVEDVDLQEALVIYAMDRVDSLHGGWQNNEGGEGTVTFAVLGGTVQVDHGKHYTRTEWDENIIKLSDLEQLSLEGSSDAYTKGPLLTLGEVKELEPGDVVWAQYEKYGDHRVDEPDRVRCGAEAVFRGSEEHGSQWGEVSLLFGDFAWPWEWSDDQPASVDGYRLYQALTVNEETEE